MEDFASRGYSLSSGSPEDIPGGVAPWAGQPAPKATVTNRVPGNLLPVPEPRPIPLVPDTAQFQVPSKQIDSPLGIQKFLSGESGQLYLAFLANLNLSLQGKKLTDPCPVSAPCQKVLDLLSVLHSWIKDIPPRVTPGRYGNPAFRDWHERLSLLGPALNQQLLPQGLQARGAAEETLPYLLDAFGNPSRIDYGTGHEANFAAWMLCLVRLGVLGAADYHALAARVFSAYLSLMRDLQSTYWLEPAGSHGVWGLDDYHFIPFILGSSQLIGHKYLRPKSIHNSDIVDQFSTDYYYLSCVAFIKKVKKGPLVEHSPMINDISGVATWDKVNSGMLKMYRAEVLQKVPIMQHFLFGTILPWVV